MSCPKCGRSHSGSVCGIPGIGVRIGIGGIGTARRQSTSTYPIKTKSSLKPKIKLTGRGLEEMLTWGMAEERKCLEMIKAMPPEMPEYNTVLETLDKAMAVNEQIRKQIALRRR